MKKSAQRLAYYSLIATALGIAVFVLARYDILPWGLTFLVVTPLVAGSIALVLSMISLVKRRSVRGITTAILALLLILFSCMIYVVLDALASAIVLPR